MRRVGGEGHTMNSLQFLRAICALGVVLYHVEDGAGEYFRQQHTLSLFSWGQLGVPMFFCLSGFVISYSGFLRPKSAVQFMYARCARIYPAYLFVTLLFVACLALLPAAALRTVPSVSLQKILLALVFNFGASDGYVYVAWTLFYEMMFYVCFAVVSARFAWIARCQWYAYGMAGLLLASLAAGRYRVADFLVGAVVFLVAVNPLQVGYRSWPMLALFASLLVGLAVHPVASWCGLAIVSLLALERWRPGWFASRRILSLGDASYSIYLIQVLTVSASLKAVQVMVAAVPFVARAPGLAYGLSLLLACMSTILLGVLLRRLVEKPAFAWLMAWRR